jgi:hypothetical protein
MKRTAILLLWIQVGYSAITNVRVVGETSTQAVIAYDAPGVNPCAVEVSESPGFDPLVHDVNGSLFAGANLDNRPGNVSSGRQRTVVIGKRIAEKASDGRYYSRALQANTIHYFRITCGSDTNQGTFRTKNIAWGVNYSDPMPVDPANPGTYGWPTIDWTPPATPDRSNNTQTIADPQTGVLLRRITGAGQFGVTSNTRSVDSVKNYGGWSSSDPALLNSKDASRITYTGDGGAAPGDWLLVRMSQFNPYGVDYSNYDNYSQIDAVTLVLRGTATGTQGDDTTVEYCLTVDGVNCTTGIKSQDLASCGSDCTLGDTTPLMKFWEAPGDPLPARLAKWDLFGREGTVNYTSATLTLDWTAGAFFNPRWISGSQVVLLGQSYPIETVNSPKHLVLASGPGADLTGTNYSAPNFGVLIRKKNRSTDTVGLDFVSFTVDLSHGSYWWESGAQSFCSDTKTTQSYSGVTRYGYHCFIPSGGGETALYWIDPESADATYLGHNILPANPGVWNGQVCNLGGGASFKPNDGNVFYCTVSLVGGGVGLMEATYTGNNLQAAYGPAPLTIRLLGEMGALTRAFTDTNPEGPSFDPAYYKNWTLSGELDDAYLKFRVVAGTQDTLGWEVIYRISTEQVVAAKATHGYWPSRGCVQHGVGGFLRSGNPAWTVATHNDLQVASSAACGGGPLKTELAASMPATGSELCPTDPFPWPTGAGCTTILVTGDVYDPDPCASENSNRGAAGFLGAFQTTRPGDVFLIDSERVQVLSVNGSQWMVLRGILGTTPAAHASGASLSEFCAGRRYSDVSSATNFWRYQEDPYGKNANLNGQTSLWPAHSTWDFDRQVGDNWGATCSGIGSCFFLRTALSSTAFNSYDPFHPERAISTSPQFAGQSAPEYQSTSHLASNQSNDSSWLMDVRPMIGGYGGTATPVGSGNRLYKIVRSLHRKQLPTEAFCGDHPLLDISGPGSSITESAADSWKYCVANAAGECYPGSAAGDVYANCPDVTEASCYTSQTDTQSNTLTDLCVFDLAPNVNQNVQVTFSGPRLDRYGEGARRLTRAMARHRNGFIYANAKALPDGSWVLTYTPWLNGVRSTVLAVKTPEMQLHAPTAFNRSTFEALPIQVVRVPPGTSEAFVEFGYDTDLRCTSRQEACVTVTSAAPAQQANETTPFYWAGEAYTGVPCTNGCSLVIPALPQRVVYYRVKYRGGGAAVGESSLGVLVSP